MAIRDTNGHAGVALAEGPEELWPVAGSEAAESPDWRSLYERERERERAEAAEARAEELRWAEVRARSDAGSWKWRWEASRRRLRKVVAETREARRAARDALALQREVERLHGLLREAGVDAGKRSTVMALRMEVARLRKKGRALEKALDARAAEVRNLHRDRIEADAVIPALRRQLRKALRRSRRQKATIGSLTREKARLGKRVRAARRRIERLEGQLAKLRASLSGLPKGKSRGSCERQERPRSERRRGQQPGAPGHGRTERPGLEERTEEHNPPSDARVCGGCGSPYAANGAEESALVEIEVSAHRRVIRRPRWRRTCGCASSPAEATAPPVPRLFARTPYGTSVWSRFLFERYACLRPLHRVSSWLSDQGLPVSPGTLADSVHRFAPLFEPVGAAILAHQNGAALRHADETGWRVRALREGDGSGYAWLWISVGRGAVRFHVDPSRSADAAMKLFEGTRCPTVLVCDRYSSYKKLARLLGGRVTLSFCWAHMRRDFIRCAAGQVDLAGWRREWLGRIATVYRLHKARLELHDPGLDRQTPAFDAAHDALSEALGGMFAAAEGQLARLPPEAREGKPLRSLLNHREGLSVFLDRPPRAARQQSRRAAAARPGHRTAPVVRLRQRDRRPLHRAHVLGDRHPEAERPRRAALARRLAGGVRRGRRPTAGRPVALAAVVDGRRTQARDDGARMSDRIECRYHGRDFTEGEMALLRKLIAGPPALNRHTLSKEFCRRIGWLKPDGGLKDMMARVTMLAMHGDGLIVLPPPKWKQRRPGPIVFGQDTEPPLFPPPTTLDEVRPLEIRTVVGGTRPGRLWNEFVARHHHLGYRTLVGAQMRYAVHDRNGRPLAMLGFSTAAWALAPRDRFIGWTPTLRRKNLPLVVDNPRFLILPWIRIPNLGSHILALVRRRLPRDWTRRYNTTPVLVETFVEVPRFTGGLYRASCW